MNEYQPVRPPPSHIDGHWGAIGLLVVGALVVSIVKPWGPGGSEVGPLAVVTPSPVPSPTASPSLAAGFNGLTYDLSIFGNHEPEATWAIWPAGYLVTLGFVIQVPGAVPTDAGGSAEPSLGPGVAPSPRPSANGSGRPSVAPSAPSSSTPAPGASIATNAGPGSSDGPLWPAEFDVPEGNHLFLIGINMPLGYSLYSVDLFRDEGAGEASVATERLQSPWPDHFAVIGIPTRAADGQLDLWPPGLYRMDMTFEPGSISRTMAIRIAGATARP